MVINPQMIVLAREYRGLTQEALAKMLFVGQARIAKIEGGIQDDIPEELFDRICSKLEFPPQFFCQKEDLIGFGSSSYFYRKKARITALDRKKIHGVVNLLRINLKKMLQSIDIESKRTLPKLDIDDYGGSASKVAQAVRVFWSMPDGPVQNLTALMENAGIIIIPVDFHTRELDATALRINEMPPLIFININMPGDRWRFTLAHELAHLILHDVPYEEMEDEADTFAAELLLPESELKPQFSRLDNIRLVDLANLKPYWKTSMGALLMRASGLGVITENQKRHLWSSISKLGWRLKEPNPIEVETPNTFRKILDFFVSNLQYEKNELSKMLMLNPRDLHELYAFFFSSGPKKSLLRIVP